MGICMEKVKIEKNTVQETLMVPLYGRKMCSEKFSELYKDIFVKKLCARLDYDFSELEKKKNWRKESRGLHYIRDYPNRDDGNFLRDSVLDKSNMADLLDSI